MPSKTFSPGDFVLVDLRGDDKWRPGIVMPAPEDVAPLVAVVCGTSKERADHLAVDHRHRWGKVLKLSVPTWFNVTQLYVVAASRIRGPKAKCPNDLFIELRVLVEKKAQFEWLDDVSEASGTKG